VSLPVDVQLVKDGRDYFAKLSVDSMNNIGRMVADSIANQQQSFVNLSYYQACIDSHNAVFDKESPESIE